VKKIIFWGDGILSGPSGYAELLGNHVFLHHPRADLSLPVLPVATSTSGDGATLADALREAPLHAIGKDPDLLYLGFGYADLRAGRPAEEILRLHRELAALVTLKSRARLALPLLVSAFFSGEEERSRARIVNQGIRSMASQRVFVVDLDHVVENFLSAHRESPGDQRALHLDCNRLTPLGQLLLAHHAFRLAPWPDFSAVASPEAAPA
jgi:hypothetical protein